MEGHARRLILVLVLVATILVPSAPDVAAANQTMAVIVVPTNQATSLGATVTATIHVFRYGVHADPTSFGLKLLLWLDEVRRHLARSGQLRARVAVGKISGAVGIFGRSAIG